MATTTWTRALAGSDVVRRNAQLARLRAPIDERYARDPLAHLEDGHVLILGLADDADDPDLVADDDGVSVRLKRVAFEPYPHEVEVIRSWVDVDYLTRTGRARFNNLHEEKSRQMGMTWTAAWVLLWALTYHPETVGLVTHLKLGKVDDGGSHNTTESIFGRIRFMAESTTADGGSTWPEHMRPADRLRFRGGNDPDITNAFTGARIVGSGATEDPARGGTYTHALVDEAARIPWGSSVQESLVRACPRGRFYNSTPRGKDNVYYELREPRRRGFIYLRHHWSQHPIYGQGAHVAGAEPGTCELCANTNAGVEWNPADPQSHRYPGKLTSPWYDQAIIELTDEQVAQELDISYERSLEARVYPEFQADLHTIDYVPYAPDVNVELSWDFGVDTTAVGIWQDYRDVLVKIGEYEAHDLAPEDVAAGLRTVLQDLGVPVAHTMPNFTREWFAIGDPAGEARQQATARSLIDDYRGLGFNITTQRQSIDRTIVALKRLLIGRPKPVRYSRETCPLTIRHLEQNRWPTDRQGRRKPNVREPLNDQHNHMLRADAYYVCFKYPPPNLHDDPTARSLFVADDEPLYRRVESYDDVPLSSNDPYRDFL
jgi:hypothetical protein